MDTNLGVIELTEKQIRNLGSLKTENIKGFSYWHDSKEVVVVSLDEVDVEALKKAVSELPDEDSKETKEALAKKEEDALIEAKIREIAVAELKVEGKLDVSGKITSFGKQDIVLAGGE